MKNLKKLQLLSFACLLVSLIIELLSSSAVAWGISLGLILTALSLNVKVIRTYGIPKNIRANSQRLAFLIAVYAFLVFGLEVI